MPTITLNVDERTEQQLTQLSTNEGIPPSEMALRLLLRAIRAKRPKQIFDTELVRVHAAQFAEEDATLAESDLPHRTALLDAEDVAL